MTNFWTAALLIFLGTSGAVWAQDINEATTDIRPETLGTVIIVPIEFQQGTWRDIADPEIVHCRPPRLDPHPIGRSRIEIRDEAGNSLGFRDVNDPRMVLIESPQEPWAPLNETQYVVMIELRGQPEKLEFIYDYDRSTTPELTIDLSEVMGDYNLNGAKRVANCENADPPFTSIRDQNLFVLNYALDQAAARSHWTKAQILNKLSLRGLTGIRDLNLPETVEQLVKESTLQIRD